MKITQEEVVDQQTVLHIELEEEDLGSYLDRGYRRVVQRTMIPGFRKGKAPRSIVEQYVGRESLLNESLDFLVPDVTDRAIAEQALETAGTPAVELTEMKPITLKATVALAPKVELNAYRDIRVEDVIEDTTEDDVQQRLDEYLKQAASWEPVERPVVAGDMVTMDVKGSVGDASIVDERDAVYVVESRSAFPFPDFHQHLEGASAGVPKEFTLTISDDHADSKLAGKEAQFTVTVSEVKEQKLPELDDEFAKGVADGYDSLADLRESVQKDLSAEAQKAHETQYREAALDELLKVVTVELPPLLVDHEVEHMVSRRDQFVERLKIRMDDYLRFAGKTEEESRGEMAENAVERLKRSYALVTLAEREGLEVSDEEIDERIEEITASGDDVAESLKGLDKKSEEVRGSIRESLLVAKSLDQLTTIAKGEAGEPADEGNEPSIEGKDQEEGGETFDS